MNDYEILGLIFMGLFYREVVKDTKEVEYKISISELANLLKNYQVVVDDDKSEEDIIRVHIVKTEEKNTLLDFLPEDEEIIN